MCLVLLCLTLRTVILFAQIISLTKFNDWYYNSLQHYIRGIIDHKMLVYLSPYTIFIFIIQFETQTSFFYCAR